MIVKFELAKIITRGKIFTRCAFTSHCQICSINSFWPDTNCIKGNQTILSDPINISHCSMIVDWSTCGSIPYKWILRIRDLALKWPMIELTKWNGSIRRIGTDKGTVIWPVYGNSTMTLSLKYINWVWFGWLQIIIVRLTTKLTGEPVLDDLCFLPSSYKRGFKNKFAWLDIKYSKETYHTSSNSIVLSAIICHLIQMNHTSFSNNC